MTADKVAEFGNRWSGWAKILATIFALLALLGFGNFIYNEVWQSKNLAYTILPSYDLQDQAFGGLVIENRGRVVLTDVQIIISDLEAYIEALRMPGAHEPATVVDGGEGYNHVLIHLPRLSPGTGLSVYILTADIVSLDASRSFIVTSDETVGKPSSTIDSPWLILIVIAGIVALAVVLAMLLFRDDRKGS